MNIAALLLGAACLPGAVLMARPAHACAIDGIPSMVIDGSRVRLNGKPPGAATWRTWAMFEAARPLPARGTVGFREEVRYVTLPKEAFSRPWRWRFGDGAQVYGSAVAHRYARDGRYKVEVAAYLPSRKGWLIFDASSVSVGWK